jgi:hypothetical protein
VEVLESNISNDKARHHDAKGNKTASNAGGFDLFGMAKFYAPNI